ncbi:MAG: glycosyl hydrolase family 28-related protein [Opitutales bacterium]
MNRLFPVFLSLFIAHTTFVQADEPPTPWITPIVYDSEGLVPVVSFDVTAPPYNADRLGRTDSTEAIQAAINDADKFGGTVYAPSGRYRIGGNLSIPAGVTLRGDWRRPTGADPITLGTVLMAYAGRGDPSAKPFITINEGGLRDLSIVYPEQTVDNIVPYPACVLLAGNSAIKHVNLVNPYIGVITGSFSTVLDVCGSPLKTGIIMLKAVAVPRCTDLRFSPRYWAESRFPGAPSFEELTAALKREQSFAIQLNRQDAGIFIDVEIDHYPIGVKVMPPHGWTYWHNVKITNAEIGMFFTGGSNHRVYVTGTSISASKYGILMQMDKTGWQENWIKLSKSGKPFGSRRDYAELRLFECTFDVSGTAVRLDGSYSQMFDAHSCTFANWGSGKDDYAIDAENAYVDVYDSKFLQSNRHIRFKSSRSPLTAKGNTFPSQPDIKTTGSSKNEIDHSPTSYAGRSLPEIIQVPDTLPARLDPESLYVVTAPPFNAPTDGETDASLAIQSALDKAGENGGGTVYLPQGRYLLKRHLTIPSGVELRGVNDFMPRGRQVRAMLIADIPQDMGNPQNPPLITLESTPELRGSGITGLTIWYLHQDFTNIQPYPFTIQSKGPGCWARRLYLGNTYNAVDFATYDNNYHVLSRVNGSALNIGFMVGNTKTIGWIDNCHIRPQDWSLSTGRNLRFQFPGDRKNKPTKDDIFRGTEHSLIPNMRGAGTITIASGANEQITGFFTNGSTRAFDFIDQNGTGGGNANILIGGSEAGWGAWVKALGNKGANIVNFSFNPMTRLPYVQPEDIPEGQLPKGMVMRIDPSVPDSGKIDMAISKFYARGEVDVGFDLLGGSLTFKQIEQEHSYAKASVDINGGVFNQRNINMGETTGSNE